MFTSLFNNAAGLEQLSLLKSTRLFGTELFPFRVKKFFFDRKAASRSLWSSSSSDIFSSNALFSESKQV